MGRLAPSSMELLAIILLLALPLAGAQEVMVGPGTVFSSGDANVKMDIIDDRIDYIRAGNGRLEINNAALAVNAPAEVNITLQRFERDVPEGFTSINFTAEADPGTEVEFTFTNLIGEARYRVLRDGSEYVTKKASSGGELSFNNSDWSTRSFDIVLLDRDALFLPREDIRLALGESLSSYVGIYNEKDTFDEYEITVQTSMSSGSVLANVLTHEGASDSATVEVAPRSSREVEVEYVASSCPEETCTGTVTFIARSLNEDVRHVDDVSVTILRNPSIYGSPGIEFIHVILLGIAGSLIFAFLRRRE